MTQQELFALQITDKYVSGSFLIQSKGELEQVIRALQKLPELFGDYRVPSAPEGPAPSERRELHTHSPKGDLR